MDAALEKGQPLHWK